MYKAGAAPTPPSPTPVKFSQMFGVNGFEWDFLNPNAPNTINAAEMTAGKTFTQFRHYLDWGRLEVTKGNYTFSPSHNGGWDYDVLYQSLKAQGIEVLADIKTLPQWMINTYPVGQQDNENVPAPYGSDLLDPNSYIDQAKLGFQFAARYGYNTSVNPALQSVDASQQYANQPKNVVKTGLGLIHYIECDNERDKWWKGRKAYQTAFEYAANLSAFYDGNKNTMGPGVGVKNADPNMQVVMCGTALATTDYVKGMVDWCRMHRGYKADGTVNLCWDVINYHLYSNNSGTSQGGNSTAGAAPEGSGAASTALDFITVAHRYVQDMPVWVTELGYDINQGSPLHAIPIGAKSAAQTQADWSLRSCLLYAREGVQRIFFYEMYDDNQYSNIQFATSGLLNANYTRRAVADYLYQANKLLGAYTYSSTISSSPFVDIYTLNGAKAYALTMPTQNGSTANYTLDLGNADSARIYTPTIGQDSMSVQNVPTVNGKLTLTVTETPTFVIPFDSIVTCVIPVAGYGGPVCEGTTLTLTSTTTPGATFAWTGPNGFTSASQNPTVPAAIAADSGLYIVTLTLAGCAPSSDSVNAIVNRKPVFTINPPVGVCAPLTIDITTAATGILPLGTTLNYYIDGGGATTLSNPNAITTSGTYYIKATTPIGCSDIKPVIATVNPQPIFTAASTICAADYLSYSIMITVSAGTLTSNVGTVTNPSSNNWVVSGIPAGTNANLALTIASGCTNTLLVNAPNCACPIIAAPTSGGDQIQCAQTPAQTLTATAVAPPGYSVRWFSAAIGGTPLSNPVLNNVGTIIYYAEAYDPGSPACGSSRIAVTLTINPQPVLSINDPATICAPATVDITTPAVIGGTIPAGTTFNYYTDLTETVSIPDPTAITTSGTYYIKAAASATCSDIEPVTVSITPIPAAPISGGDQIVCKEDPIQLLTATATSTATTVWYNSPGGTTTVNPVLNSIGSVTYYAEANVLGCKSTIRTPVTLTIVDPPQVSVSETNLTISEGQTAQLSGYVTTATLGDIPTYAWRTDYNISNPDPLTVVIAPDVDTAYVFEAASSLLPTCTATATAHVTVLKVLPPIVVANIFSPNGDKNHDFWDIKELDEYPNAEVQVFDRYGQVVFESDGNYSKAPWTGDLNGQPLPVGTYYYIINLNSGTPAGAAPLTGFVAIVR